MFRGRSLAGNILRVGRRLLGWLKTLQARGEATLGRDARIMSTGHIESIARKKDSITIGVNTIIAGQLVTCAHGGRIKIGDWGYVGANSNIWSAAEIIIGDRTLISHGVNIHDNESHPLNAAQRAAQYREIATTGHPNIIDGIRAAPIRIGDDVWIGFGATIRKGVTIGDRAIIGACSIVDCDVPADAILKPAGTPLRADRKAPSGLPGSVTSDAGTARDR